MSNSEGLQSLQEIFPNFPIDFLIEIQKRAQAGFIDYNKLLDLNDKYQGILIHKYKIYQCPLPQCTLKDCPFYHSIQDQRRDPQIFNYSKRPCYAYFIAEVWTYNSICTKGKDCLFSHNKYEITYHPESNNPIANIEKSPEKKFDTSFVLNKCNKIVELREELREIEKNNYKENKEYQILADEVKTLREISMCFICKIELYSYILPCGHLCCELCQLHIENVCPICNSRINRAEILKLRTN